jgi:hypothetical protein
MLRGVKAPAERTTTANLLVTLRKARGFTAGKAAAAHVREQTGVVGLSDSVWASYESGTRKISDKHRAAIESVFGAIGAAEPQPTNTAPEMFDLLAAMAQQTTMVTELVKELRAERQERTSMADTVTELRAEIRALAAGLAEALKGSGGGAGPAQEPSQGGQGGPPPAGKKTPSHSPVTDR